MSLALWANPCANASLISGYLSPKMKWSFQINELRYDVRLRPSSAASSFSVSAVDSSWGSGGRYQVPHGIGLGRQQLRAEQSTYNPRSGIILVGCAHSRSAGHIRGTNSRRLPGQYFPRA